SAASGGERLFWPQILAAVLAILSGGSLWRLLHQGTFETTEKILGVGVVCALIALTVQVVVVGNARGKLRQQIGNGDTQRMRIVLAHRLAAVLLLATTVAMAAARFA